MLQKKGMNNNDNTKNKVIKGLVGWMEDLEDSSLEELREIRKELGHDVEKDETEFLETLRNNYKNLNIDLKKEKLDKENDDFKVKPFLGYVSDETGLPPSKIEQELGYKTEFLIGITETPQVVKEAVREKIADDTISKFPNLNRNRVLRSLKQSSQKMAAARNEEYKNEEITFEKILDSSEMKDKEFWLKLNQGE